MIDHWIVEADTLNLRYHTLAENPEQAISNWFEDLESEEIPMEGGLIVSDADDTEEHLRSIAFEALRRNLISNSTFYKVVNDRGIDVDNTTCELLRKNKGVRGVFQEIENGFFRKFEEEEEDDEWNDW